uniref:Uncharacterized protein n=1 Tax=Strongyloides papillosus TaxID=174720 RepID=A0A0N5BTG9_STREA
MIFFKTISIILLLILLNYVSPDEKYEDNFLFKKDFSNGKRAKDVLSWNWKPFYNTNTKFFDKNLKEGILSKYDPYYLMAEISRKNNELRNKVKYRRPQFFITN